MLKTASLWSTSFTSSEFHNKAKHTEILKKKKKAEHAILFYHNFFFVFNHLGKNQLLKETQLK